MRNFLHFFTITFAVLASLVIFVIFIIPIGMMVVGYKVNATATSVATLAAEKKDVEVCRSLISYGPLSPPTGEKRRTCIRIYAELTKDPSVCELLMPSEYGWECLAAAQVINERQCGFDFGPQPAMVYGKNLSATMTECIQGPKNTQNHECCVMARTLYVEKDNTCEALKDQAMVYDQCLELMARRDRNLGLCSDIQAKNLQSACEVAVKALKH